eukprot:3135957-Amphidinium_carterae.2
MSCGGWASFCPILRLFPVELEVGDVVEAGARCAQQLREHFLTIAIKKLRANMNLSSSDTFPGLSSMIGWGFRVVQVDNARYCLNTVRSEDSLGTSHASSFEMISLSC